ncbi:hypothetical protein NE237_014247 [Protea cynaroides]|uniref:Uncharacterized protein n=1 Tax=Protea cynaroides TaxID=273540 RepID=A0A9Q0GMT9_9MAGN|nr:hypothetical protein NE237_014247 [Protea cynaroides]
MGKSENVRCSSTLNLKNSLGSSIMEMEFIPSSSKTLKFMETSLKLCTWKSSPKFLPGFQHKHSS